MKGFVYLLHFDKPIGDLSNPRGQAQHYIGFTTDLEQRIKDHQSGNSARIVHAFHSQGIGFTLAQVWNTKRSFERKLKNRKNAKHYCPVCKQKELECNYEH